jgi:hypothetical protein
LHDLAGLTNKLSVNPPSVKHSSGV